MRSTFRAGLAAAVAIAAAATASASDARHAVMMSVDGLMPAYYRRADELGLKIPNLRRLMRDGVYGRVTGVLPSVTYPSHTTLLTGVTPRVHGIQSNTLLDPEGRSNGAWNWYARSVRVPTLVSAARARWMTTASVSWPVSVGLGSDFNLPEFWRSGSEHTSDLQLLDLLSTPGLISAVSQGRGRPFPFPLTDQERVDTALHLIRTHRPHLLVLHIFELDGKQHDHGPLTPEAREAVERSDAQIGRVIQALADAGIAERSLFAVVSDHGFLPVSQGLKPNVLLRDAGLLKVDDKGKVTEWRAYFQADGGSAALRLKDAADTAALESVRALVAPKAGAKGSGIRRVLDAREVEALGGSAEVPLVLSAEEGFSFLPAADGAYQTTPRYKGTHGHAPDREELEAALLLTAPGLTKRGDVGVVKMTSIAPTLARFLGLELSSQADRSLDLW
jgi:predicted AlkP superfamily pyrophosphatase or phosphodiesterase